MNDQSKSAEPRDQRVEAALRDYLERVDRGEAVDRKEFLSRHAEIADQLRSFIAAEDEVRKLAGVEPLSERSHNSTRSFAAHGQETIVPRSVVIGADSGETELAGQFGRYRIIRALGKGAMGIVYMAEDTHIERQVALKMPHFTADPTGEQRERFFREARAAGTLRHPHICPVYDFGQIDGKHYISMAYIEGRPLSAFIQPRKPQTERQIVIVIRKLALALQEAHDHAIVHRDLKPSNIMVDKRGEPIVMDFGLAQQVRRNEDVRLTQTGNILGTPAFMSPEQVEGAPAKIGAPTDQYSLGVILFELLTGELPFQGPVSAVMAQILTKESPRPSLLRADLDPRIEAVCLKMMSKKAPDRFPSLTAVADELATILKAPPARATAKDGSASDRIPPHVTAPDELQRLSPQTLTAGDLASLEKLARECYSRRDFEQVSQLVERIPQERRNAALQTLLKKSREKIEKIASLIRDLDDAVRRNDRPTALRKAEEVLKFKPGHHRAREINEKYAGQGDGGSARLGSLRQFTRPWNEWGWIPWSLLACGLAVCGVMAAVIMIHPDRSAEAKKEIAAGTPNRKTLETAPEIANIGLRPPLVAPSKITAPQSPQPSADHLEAPVEVTNPIGMTLALIPAGEFQMGAGDGEPTRAEEKPQHRVRISKPFYLGPYETTQGDFARFMGRNPSYFSPVGDGKQLVSGLDTSDFPVENVSWYDAIEFCNKRSVSEKLPPYYRITNVERNKDNSIRAADVALAGGNGYRLPTEAEWEYACRIGTATPFHFGFALNGSEANCNGTRPYGTTNKGPFLKRTTTVGSYNKPNALGLFDMHGNVREWCWDVYDESYYGQSPKADPIGPNSGSPRVNRGGSWVAHGVDCRAAHRSNDLPDLRSNRIGFRVARFPAGK